MCSSDLEALSCAVWPFSSERLLRLIVIDESGTDTVTVHEAVFPLEDAAVIVALPPSTAVTVPSEPTVAILLFELVQLIALSCVVSAGETEAASCAVWPFSSERLLRLIVIDESGTDTVTVHEAVFPLEDAAVIVALPPSTAVTVPSEPTVAILLFELVQLIALSCVVSAGETEAASCAVWPFLSERLLRLILNPLIGIIFLIGFGCAVLFDCFDLCALPDNEEDFWFPAVLYFFGVVVADALYVFE